jgi:hypothetical protein
VCRKTSFDATRSARPATFSPARFTRMKSSGAHSRRETALGVMSTSSVPGIRALRLPPVPDTS